MGKVIMNAVLPTETKLLCGCPIEYNEDGYRVENSGSSCPVCRKEKGAFPILNKKAVEEAVAVVLALNGKITQYTLFDRIRGEDGLYQNITQCSYPIGTEGYVSLRSGDMEDAASTADEWQEKNPETGDCRIRIETMRLKESEEEWGIPVLEIISGNIQEEQNPYYIEEIETILLALGLEEWEIIETDDVIETMESQKKVSYLPDPDIPPVIISQWWTDQIAAKHPEMIHIEEPEMEEDDDF